MPKKAYAVLAAGEPASAAQRLSSENASGKTGSPYLTVKMRNRFTEFKATNPDSELQFPEWLRQEGYDIGANEHVYKLD